MSDAETTRDRVLACARDLYLREGLAGFNMRKVAACAGLSAPAIYRHFDSKEALLMAVAAEGFRLFGRHLWQGLEGRSPGERLERTGMGYLQFGLAHPAYYRVMFMSTGEELGFSEMPEESQQQAGSTFTFLVDRVRECMDAGVLAEADENEVAATIWSQCHGLVSLYRAGHFAGHVDDDEAFTEFYRRSVAALLRGLGP